MIFLILYFGLSVSLQRPAKDDTYGEAVGQARAGGVAARGAVALQDTVVQQVPRPLRREGGAFALHDAQLTHHTGTWKKKKKWNPSSAI